MKRQGEGNMTLKTEIGVTHLHANDRWQIPEARRRQARILP